MDSGGDVEEEQGDATTHNAEAEGNDAQHDDGHDATNPDTKNQQGILDSVARRQKK
jgi:hypothetical protein